MLSNGIRRHWMQEFPAPCMITHETIWPVILVSLLGRNGICLGFQSVFLWLIVRLNILSGLIGPFGSSFVRLWLFFFPHSSWGLLMRESFVNLDTAALMALYLVNNSARLLFYLLMLSLTLRFQITFFMFFKFCINRMFTNQRLQTYWLLPELSCSCSKLRNFYVFPTQINGWPGTICQV